MKSFLFDGEFFVDSYWKHFGLLKLGKIGDSSNKKSLENLQ